MTDELFCSRCRKWKAHNWHIDHEDKIKILKCSKCGRNKKMEKI